MAKKTEQMLALPVVISKNEYIMLKKEADEKNKAVTEIIKNKLFPYKNVNQETVLYLLQKAAEQKKNITDTIAKTVAQKLSKLIQC